MKKIVKNKKPGKVMHTKTTPEQWLFQIRAFAQQSGLISIPH